MSCIPCLRWSVTASLFLLATALLLPMGSSQAPTGKGYALLVGVSDYTSGRLTRLDFTENDVEEMARLLDRPGSPYRGNVRVLSCARGRKDKKDRPTAENIRKALLELRRGRTRHDSVLLALSGHGVQLRVRDPKGKRPERSYGYFCPVDADIAGPDFETGRHPQLLLLQDLMDDLGECGAGIRLVFIDACRNVVRARARAFDASQVTIPTGVGVFFSCKPGEHSYEALIDDGGKKKGHGVFFHFVLKGLAGEAKNRRGEVTWSRLVEYVTEKVTDDAARLVGEEIKQTPHLVANIAGKSPLLYRPTDEVVVRAKDRLPREIENSIGMKLVLVPEGKFIMGSPADEVNREDDETQHEVTISRPFYMGIYEVTQEEYRQVMGNNPSYFRSDGPGKDRVKGAGDTGVFPVENISWHDAVAFCRRLTALTAEKKAGRLYRLPTEAEWEYACRASAPPAHPFGLGKSLSSTQANFDGTFPFGGGVKGPYLRRTCKVGSFTANAWGLFDMHGNVWEWCHDWYEVNYYKVSPARDPLGPKTGTQRVLRGGSWSGDGWYCRSAVRFKADPDRRYDYFGFRVVCVPVPQGERGR